jgi:serine/threonine-protein kinase HipA
VLLVERFDRTPTRGERRMVVSVLTILELDEMAARHATYHELAEVIAERFTEPKKTLRELFSRIVFNICVGNTDDHARNHAAFWDGQQLTLTPAYDICPQPRSGGEVAQAIEIGRDGFRMSQFVGCVAAADVYGLTPGEARDIIDRQLEIIATEWDDAADVARLTKADRQQMWARQILNPYALEGYPTSARRR